MTKSSKTWLRVCCAAIGLSLLLCGQTFSAVIYQDDFNRTGALNGTAPTVNAPSATYMGFGGTDGFYTSTSGGGFAYNANTTNISHALAYLPLTMQPGVYSLSLTMKPNVGASGDWIGLGFTEVALNTLGQGWLPSGNPQLWLLYHNNGNTSSFYGGGLSNGAGGTTGTPGNAVRFTIELDSVSGAFTISDSANLNNRTGTLSATSLSSIHYIGFSIYRGASGEVSNLNLSFTPSTTTVPEPTSLAIFGLGALCVAFRARRKRQAKTIS